MNPRACARRWDERLGSPPTVLHSTLQLRARQRYFERCRTRRRAQYGDCGLAVESHPACVQALQRDGFAVVRNAVGPKALASVRAELECLLHRGAAMNPISRDSVRHAGDLSASQQFLTAAEVARGQEYFRHHTNFAVVSDPLLNCPSVQRVERLTPKQRAAADSLEVVA